jgi:hypothetical protein
MTQPINPNLDAWAAHTEQAVRAYKSENGSSLRDYVSPPHPVNVVRIVEPNVPKDSPDYAFEKTRLTEIHTPSGKVLQNPWGVSATPVAQKQSPRPVPTAEQVAAELETLKQAVSIAEDQFEADKANRPAIHARMAAIGSELGPLVERVRALEAELIELKAIPTPEAAFTASVAAHEFAVQQAAGHTLECLQENWAQHIFGISFRRNPGNLKGASDSARDDINLGLDALRPYIGRH